jgi:hypothetical protein
VLPFHTLDVNGTVYSSGAVTGGPGTFTDTTTDGTGLTGQANIGSNAWGVYGVSAGGIGVRGYSNAAAGSGGEFENSAATGKAVRAIVNNVEVMNVDASGVHAGPAMTGTPVAHGFVWGAGGSTGSHPPNFSSHQTATGEYDITVTGVNLDNSNYTIIVTTFVGYCIHNASGTLHLSTKDPSGNAADRNFTVVIFKM